MRARGIRGQVVAVAAASLVACSLVACGGSTPTPGSSATQSTPATPAPVGDERGRVVFQEPVQQTDAAAAVPGVAATKIRYRSTSGVDGGGTEVSGTVFVPPGPAPAGGWPIVTVGHGTTGVDDDCAPSRYPNLLGSIGLVIALLQRGFVVTVSDFQGLGTDGPHPYLEPNSAAYNLIDAVRAARSIVPDTSTRWAALGVSQGGQASWAAAEVAADYGAGLDFVGSANLSPAADISGVAPANGDVQLTLPQQMFIPLLIAGLEVLHPDLDPTAYMRGALAANNEILRACTGQLADRKVGVALQLTKADSEPRSPEDVARMREWLEELALPKRTAAAPMLVVIGATDNLIPPAWTEAAVARACDLGDVVDLQLRSSEGHADSKSVPDAVAWIADRFAGKPAPNTCQGG